MRLKVQILNLSVLASLLGCSHGDIKDIPMPVQNGQTRSIKPKYGFEAVLLSSSHEFIQHSPAPDFWAINPYYVGQQTDSACSLATAVMIVNAARVGLAMKSDEELASQSELLKKLGDKTYESEVAQDGPGVNLDQMKTVLEQALLAYGIKRFTIDIVHTTESSDGTQNSLHKMLVENETSSRNYIVANFNQGTYTGDTQAGHFAPIGAYDQKKKRVLIMDPDRKWYEPYWVSESTFLKGMATKDSDTGHSRGYLWIRLLDKDGGGLPKIPCLTKFDLRGTRPEPVQFSKVKFAMKRVN